MNFSELNIRVVHHSLAFKFLAKTSRDELRTKDTSFIILKDKNGATGIGEASIIPGLSVENPLAFRAELDRIDVNSLENYHQRYIDFPAIRFGIETALLDLINGGQRQLFSTEFAQGKAPIPINGLVWMGDSSFMRKQIAEKLESGFTCIKLKIGALNFKQELGILEGIRKEFSANEIEIRVDANGAFNPEKALEKLKRLSDFQLHSIEQPIKQGQWEQMADLCMKTPLDIALDEELIGITFLDKKAQLLERIQPHYIILKPSLLGGFQASEEWISLCKTKNIQYWNTSALESNIGLNAISQWTSSLTNPLPQGLGTGGLYSNNISSPLQVEKGEIFYNTEQSWDLSLLVL